MARTSSRAPVVEKDWRETRWSASPETTPWLGPTRPSSGSSAPRSGRCHLTLRLVGPPSLPLSHDGSRQHGRSHSTSVHNLVTAHLKCCFVSLVDVLGRGQGLPTPSCSFLRWAFSLESDARSWVIAVRHANKYRNQPPSSLTAPQQQ